MAELLEMRGIHKRFGGVVALEGVDFRLAEGQVHALIGENGAGKSTLIKILSGAHQPDEGEIVLDGGRVTMNSPREAQERGVATIYQEGSLYPDLSILENLFIGHQPRTRFGALDWSAMRRQTSEVFDRLKIRVPLSTRAGDLSRAQTKLVEIARALLREARIIIMDEPTAALPSDDVDRLFEIVRELSDEGVAVIYISHRLEEIFEVAERVTVLRDGKQVGEAEVSDVDNDWLIEKMVGRALDQLYPRTIREPGAAVLEVRGLTRRGVFEDITFTIREGEVVGLAGLVGSGRSEVARAIFGLDPYDSGSVLLRGQPLPTSPSRVIERGVALLPEDRTKQGLVLPFSVRNNITLAVLDDVSDGTFMNHDREVAIADRFIESLNIRTPSWRTPTEDLSGGNQQKVVLSKWLAAEPQLLILDEPTQGVDVGAKAELHHLIDDLVQGDVGVLLISSDLEEVLGMADRILVMHRGEIADELPRSASAEEVMRAATGLTAEAGIPGGAGVVGEGATGEGATGEGAASGGGGAPGRTPAAVENVATGDNVAPDDPAGSGADEPSGSETGDADQPAGSGTGDDRVRR